MENKFCTLFRYAINSLAYAFCKNKLVIYASVYIRNGKIIPQNWGDDINVYFWEYITGCNVIVANQSLFHRIVNRKAYSSIGSIVGWFGNEKTEIWGSGAISSRSTVRIKPDKVHSVRGPLTRRLLMSQGIECPERYGDPALLLSKYYTPKTSSKKYRIGLIPHYVDIDNPVIRHFVKHNDDTLLINLRKYKNWTDIIDEVAACELIVSSSLHGLIVSDSYGIPNIWVSYSDKICGGTFKFLDYFESVGRTRQTVPIRIREERQLCDLTNNLPTDRISIDYDAIISTCPFKDKIKVV